MAKTLQKFGAAVLSLAMLAMSFAPALALANQGNSTAVSITTISDPISGSHHSPFNFSCNVNPLYNPVTVSGSATADAPPGNLSQYHVQIDWGDGHQDNQTEASSFGSGQGTATRSYSGTHTYTTTGTMTIKARIYHQSTPGNDGQADSVVTVSTCVYVPPPATASVLVTKTVVGGSAVPSNFTLNVVNASSTPNNFHPTTGTTTVLVTPGAYQINEVATSTYTPSYSAGCSGTLVAGQVVVCRVTNTYVAPTVGTLHIVKHVVNDNGGTATANQWTMNVSASTTPNHFAGSENGVDVIVTPGSYSVTESGGPAGYAASFSNGCSGTIAAGQTATCTITNNDIVPLLTLLKQVVNKFRGSALASAWTLTATGATTSITGTTPVTSGSNFLAGTYALSESNGPTGYTASTWSCVTNNATTTGAFVLAKIGTSTTCTIVNSDIATSSLTVIKHVTNSNGTGSSVASDFTISVNGGHPAPASFAGNENGTYVELDGDASYNVTESGPNGYAQNFSTDCSGTMTPGAQKVCTITNSDLPPTTGSLTIIKKVINDNGGTMVVSNFPLHAVASTSAVIDFTSGNSQQVLGGTYHVTEDSVPSYSATYSGDCNSDGNVTVVNGQSAVCTITNDDIAPALTVTKVVDNTHGGTAHNTDWTVAAIGSTSTISGAGTASGDNTLQAGVYTLSESNGPTNYTAGSWSCTNGVVVGEFNQILLNVGSSTTCSITNTAKQGSLTVIKTVINDNGGTKAPSDFTMLVNGTNVSSASFPGNASGTVVTLDAGEYSVSENQLDGYGATFSDSCSGTIASGESKVCTVTNDDGKASLTVVKHTVGADGSFTFTLTGSDNIKLTTTNNSASATMALNAGTYDLAEIVPQGWSLNGSHPSCVYDGESVGIPSITNGETLGIDTGDSVVCTFTDTAVGSDLSLAKSVDNTTPAVGATIVYTLTASNAGPAMSASSTVHDALPAGLTYVSDDSNVLFSTTTQNWSVGPLAAGSSSVLHITATVNAGTAGQVIVNSATISLDGESNADYNGDNNTGSATITVTTPATPPSNGGGGGGGGGGGVINGPLSFGFGGNGGGVVLGTSTEAAPSCSKYLNAYIRMGKVNDSSEVTKLQNFLNNLEGNKLTVNGIYDDATLNAVNNFQIKYANDVLIPWGTTEPTGFVYYTTQKEINTIYCHFAKQFPLNADQEAEIARIKALGISYNPGKVLGASTGPGAGTPNHAAATVVVGSTNSTEPANGTSTAPAPSKGSFWSKVVNWMFHR